MPNNQEDNGKGNSHKDNFTYWSNKRSVILITSFPDMEHYGQTPNVADGFPECAEGELFSVEVQQTTGVDHNAVPQIAPTKLSLPQGNAKETGYVQFQNSESVPGVGATHSAALAALTNGLKMNQCKSSDRSQPRIPFGRKENNNGMDINNYQEYLGISTIVGIAVHQSEFPTDQSESGAATSDLV